MEIYDFFKEVVNACNNNKLCCTNCPMLTIKFKSRHYSCVEHLFDYFIEKNEMVAQEIYDEFKKLNIVRIPVLDNPTGKKTYKQQLKIFEKYCKSNNLEIE